MAFLGFIWMCCCSASTPPSVPKPRPKPADAKKTDAPSKVVWVGGWVGGCGCVCARCCLEDRRAHQGVGLILSIACIACAAWTRESERATATERDRERERERDKDRE